MEVKLHVLKTICSSSLFNARGHAVLLADLHTVGGDKRRVSALESLLDLSVFSDVLQFQWRHAVAKSLTCFIRVDRQDF